MNDEKTIKEVETNMGTMPIEDYQEIVAMQNGFDSYDEYIRECKKEIVAMQNGFNSYDEYIIECEKEKDKSCWYEERWYDEDLENALLYYDVPVNDYTVKLMREKCKHIFDDKSERNEMLQNVALELKESLPNPSSGPVQYMIIITEPTTSKDVRSFVDAPWDGLLVGTFVGRSIEDFRSIEIPGVQLLYQLFDSVKGCRISYGAVDFSKIASEMDMYEKNHD